MRNEENEANCGININNTEHLPSSIFHLPSNNPSHLPSSILHLPSNSHLPSNKLNHLPSKTGFARFASLVKLDTNETVFDTEAIGKLKDVKFEKDSHALDLTLVNTFRNDKPKRTLAQKQVLKNAPKTEANCISVPKIFGGEE